jgi:hypothetical protein
MPQRPDEPLTKITLNLYTRDVEKFEMRYGYGWSEVIRRLVRKHIKEIEHDEAQDAAF